MRHLDLFSGIGGFAIATEMVWDDVEHIFCDNDPFCQAILKKHWPNSLIYGDIREVKANSGRLERIGLLTGGFPCQPFSAAGRRRGTEDDRHLWPEMFRVIKETKPTYVVAENVAGLLTWSDGVVFETVCSDLESEGYEVGAFVIPACAVNAPHRRDRVWVVGHAKYHGFNGSQDREGRAERSDNNEKRTDEFRQPQRTNSIRETIADPDFLNDTGEWPEGERGVLGFTTSNKNASDPKYQSEGYKKRGRLQQATSEGIAGHREGNWDWNQDWIEVAATLCRVDDGLPRRLDRNPRLKALGNAIVPQVAAQIIRAIEYV